MINLKNNAIGLLRESKGVLIITLSVFLATMLEDYRSSYHEDQSRLKSLISLVHDLKLDYKIFHKSVESDSIRFEDQNSLISLLMSSEDSSEISVLIDDLLSYNLDSTTLWSNVMNERVNYIDLNRSGYNRYLNELHVASDLGFRANVDWLFEGLLELYKINTSEVRRSSYEVFEILIQMKFANKKRNNSKLISLKNRLIEKFLLYKIFVDRDRLVKKEILEELFKLSNDGQELLNDQI